MNSAVGLGKCCERAANPSRCKGTITLIAGCMFSGKTTELIRRLSVYPAGKTVVFKHASDDRYGVDSISTHDGEKLPARRVSNISAIAESLAASPSAIAIDEGHFFEREILALTRKIADSGIDVFITALDRDSWGQPFPLILEFMALSDVVLQPRTRCARCGAVANRTHRKTPIVGGNLIGGPESYEPRCRRCWSPPQELPPTDNSWLGKAREIQVTSKNPRHA